MKPSYAFSLAAVAGCLVSCCCPHHTQWPNDVRTTKHPPKYSTSNVAQTIMLPVGNPLRVIPRSQEGFYSCWATSAEMIMEFIGRVRVRQCVQAGQLNYGSTCCDAGRALIPGSDCDTPNLPDFRRWGFDYKYSLASPLDWTQVTREIDQGRPFAFSWTLTNPNTGASSGISHMMVVIGYDEGKGEKALLCLNPRPLGSTDYLLVPFAEYAGKAPAASGGLCIHEHDYFIISPAP